ncbi:multidrug DMT transporter permease [Streptomyces cyaneogriseus subsp. noncyanogenus]|uniref:Multidrug DMT transporter permease n=1 Tax=Streptomyces cyaneogriseus subsp. noncyanogenus TaxID=477245 RepID=A0A0C5GM09_9ACTN|nr:EamA family transporter [Streptomyces cyaneogriseus]AJP05491.1 multidrug DMT transporter permease [Streptomyces cyaneogriseus subsp. noncyanogenus]
MGELLALLSALCFGITHFVNGLVSRRHDGLTVALHAQLGGTVLGLILALSLNGGSATLADHGWGALSGVGTGVGVAFLYRAMSKGAMSVVVPVSDVGAVALPVLVGVCFLGERPGVPAWLGIAAVLPALWLVSQSSPEPDGTHQRGTVSAGVPSALVASVGFGVQFLAMAQVDKDSGLWPVVLSRVVSVAVIAVVLGTYGASWRLRGWPWAATVAAGALGTLAIVLYLEATRQQLMAIATVLSALYPAIPVLLALVVLKERLNRGQVAGLVCAALAVGLIALR